MRIYVEIVEAPDHPWFSRLSVPSRIQIQAAGAAPLFAAFIGAALEHKKQKLRPAAAMSDPKRAPACVLRARDA